MAKVEQSEEDIRDLAKALLRTKLRADNPKATREDFKAAWSTDRRQYKKQSRAVLRRLSRAGIKFQRSE